VGEDHHLVVAKTSNANFLIFWKPLLFLRLIFFMRFILALLQHIRNLDQQILKSTG